MKTTETADLTPSHNAPYDVARVRQDFPILGIGAVAGGVAGGLLGSHIGRGSGKDAATVVGVVGGAVAGHQAERYIRKTTKWEIIVRFEDGTAREFDFNTQPAWRVGDKVKVENNVITAR